MALVFLKWCLLEMKVGSYKVIEEPPTTFLRCSASACLLETGCRQYILNHSSWQGAVAYLRTCFLKPSTVRLSRHKIILEATHHHCQKWLTELLILFAWRKLCKHMMLTLWKLKLILSQAKGTHRHKNKILRKVWMALNIIYTYLHTFIYACTYVYNTYLCTCIYVHTYTSM